MSQRFYCPEPPSAGRFRLPPDEARHLLRVCRHGPGDVVEIFNGRGFATPARIVEAGKDLAVLTAEGEPTAETPPPCALTLATAIPKGDRFDWLVEKATELGVVRLVPLLCEHSVVDPRGTKLNRLRRAIVEASKQCRRNTLMVLEMPCRWTDLIQSTNLGLRFLADPAGLAPGAWPRIVSPCEVILAVGPEGGLSRSEQEEAVAGGWHSIRLGSYVLRVETAALAGAATILACAEAVESTTPAERSQPVH